MATIQELENLHSIKRSFMQENSLESAVLCQRIDKIIERTEKLLHQRSFLREERRKVRSACEYLDMAQASITKINRPDWYTVETKEVIKAREEKALHAKNNNNNNNNSKKKKKANTEEFYPPAYPPTFQVNMSGLMFEVASSTLLRDKESVLAKILIDAYPPVRIPIQDENENTPMISPVPNSNSITNAGSISNSSAGPAGLTPIQALPSVTYERDWWLFRYILAFLRDGTLPGDQETSLLIALYKEAAFYNMVELQHAIEDRKLRLRESSSASNGSLNNNNVKKLDDKDELWWKQLPSWFHAVDLVAEAKKEEYKKKSEGDWWLDTSYKGKNFGKPNKKDVWVK